MNRVNLLANTAMTPAERAKGRFMRAPDGHESGGTGVGIDDLGVGNDSSTTGNNGAGNSGDSGAGDDGKNNSGQGDPTAGFWDKSQEADTGSGDSGEEGKAIGAELAQMISGAQFAPVFTKELADQIAEGNLDGINQAMAQSHQAAMKQSVGVFAKLLEAVTGRMQADFDSRIQKALGGDKANQALESHFPAAKDPAIRPMIQQVFDQSLANTKGNVAEAVKQTNAMLKAFGTRTGLTTPPADPSGSSDNSKSLVDELLSRGG
jgi:hypothetical protein